MEDGRKKDCIVDDFVSRPTATAANDIRTGLLETPHTYIHTLVTLREISRMDANEFDSRNLSMIVDNIESALLNELRLKKKVTHGVVHP